MERRINGALCEGSALWLQARYAGVVDAEVFGASLIVLGVIISALELLVPGLIVLPFGLGAIVAGVSGLFGVPPLFQVAIFIVASLCFFLALRPIARRFNAGTQHGIGSSRLIGAEGVVLEHIPRGETGLVRIDREEWRAEAISDVELPVGARIRVIQVRGTRVLVETIGAESPTSRFPV